MKTHIDMDTRGHSTDSHAGAWFGRARRSLSELREGFLKARRRRLAIRELRSLPDRVLNDIGIDRNQILEVVDGLLAQDHGTEANSSRTLNTDVPAVRCHQGCPA